MKVKPWKNRAFKLSSFMAIIACGIWLILSTFNENMLFYFGPSDLIEKGVTPSDKLIRIGGLVKEKSISSNGNSHKFIITDFVNEVSVEYEGILPALFKEGQGTVALGFLKDKNFFQAKELLAKHDEKYMPKEVTDTLKKSGHWQE